MENVDAYDESPKIKEHVLGDQILLMVVMW